MFVRTKDVVYKVLNMKTYCGKKFYYVGNEMAIPDDKVIKQADTIDELCDGFVLLERNSKPRIFETLKGAINNKIYDDEVIYGAIWTDKGLIYVAKMNDKGELELI